MMKKMSGMQKNIDEQEAVITNLVEKYPEDIQDFAESLLSREQIFIVATGASLNAALSSVPAFAHFANRVPIVLPASEIMYYSHLFNEKNAVVLISQSGNSYETVQMCELMKKNRSPFWGITNEPDSSLANMADHLLFMEAEKEVSSATKTYTASVLLLQMAAAWSSQNKAITELPQCVSQTLHDCKESAYRIAEQLNGITQLYILGDNINGPTAREAALMFKEKVLLHAEGMTASEFRHGAVEVCQKGLKVLMCAPTRQNIDEMKKHFHYLSGLGCDVTWISPWMIDGLSEGSYIPISVPSEDTLTQIPAVIPFQYMTEHLSDFKGYDVDGFRYLTKVVAKY